MGTADNTHSAHELPLVYWNSQLCTPATYSSGIAVQSMPIGFLPPTTLVHDAFPFPFLSLVGSSCCDCAVQRLKSVGRRCNSRIGLVTPGPCSTLGQADLLVFTPTQRTNRPHQGKAPWRRASLPFAAWTARELRPLSDLRCQTWVPQLPPQTCTLPARPALATLPA